MNLPVTRRHQRCDGGTGQAIIRAIVAGERDPLKLAQLRFPGCKSSEDDIAKALTGTWQSEHLFELKQNLQLVDCYTQTLRDCDAELEQRFAAIKPRWDAPAELPQLPKAKADSRSKNAPAYNARAVYHLLKFKTPYQDIGAKAYEQQDTDRELAHLRKKAAKLGYALTATIP